MSTRLSAEQEFDELAAELQRSLGDEYELDRLVGQGGFGRVYRAHDLRLDRAVAIKVLRPDFAEVESFVAQFHREGIALAKLRHPGIVPIYDIRHDSGLVYLIMPFIEGETLRSRLARSGRLPPKEVHRILVELCDSLNAAHRADIVHRDIKPDNVILEGSLKKALLMDFGIASSRDSSEETGAQAGTPHYMSPEQITGGTTIDHRSDLYAFGALAYHLLCGAPPFTGSDARAVMAMHLTVEPTPIRRQNPSVSLAFADIIEHCLAKDPEHRPASMMDVWLSLQGIEFFAPAVVERAPPPILSKNTWLFGWSALAVLIVGEFGLGSTLAALGRGDWRLAALGLGACAALSSPAALEELRERFGIARRRDVAPLPSTTAEARAVAPDGAADASTLFDTLSPAARRRFEEVPDVVRRLESAAVMLRARLQAIDVSLASPGHAEADALREQRAVVEGRLGDATAALESLRLDILRLTAGATEHGPLTNAVEHARIINDEVDRLLASQKEAERVLRRTNSASPGTA